MSSSSMPPPPSPLAHRRTRVSTAGHYPPSPPCSPETSCAGRKMSLSKGATFHVPSPPPTDESPVLSIRHLSRRSPTCSQSSLIGLLFEKEDGAARSIQNFERTFCGARGKQQAHRRAADEVTGRSAGYLPGSLSSDEGFASSISTCTDKDLTGVFERALDLDSGLGSSIKSESAKEAPVRARGETSEEDSLSVKDLIQGVVNKAPSTRQHSLVSEAQSAIVRSISPVIPGSSRQPPLSNFARKKFADDILHPILREDRFKSFHPLVSNLGSRTSKTIKCLRDLEQSLIFEPLVSSNLQPKSTTNAYAPSTLKRLVVSPSLYRSFGEFSIQLVLDTFHHLSESEQRRVSDRPYDNGYFLDLVQQVGRLAAQVGAARQARSGQSPGAPDTDKMDYSGDDEVTLEGGLSESGRPAELVRWKNGEGVSLRTNERYEAQPVIKRQRSNESLDGDAERSMARRKKNAEPRNTELRCSDRSCDKVFARKCDLAKHEKTHSRPFKCPVTTCRYHEQGLPTEKERDRHINDKHSDNPRYFHCQYCPFKTKRDSNCKQHMEKKHGWNYERVKGNAKSTTTPQQTPQTPSLSTPSLSDGWGNASIYGSDSDSNFTPKTRSLNDFADSAHTQTNLYQSSLFPPNPQPPQSGAYSYGSPELSFDNVPHATVSSGPAAGSMNFASPYAYPHYLESPLTPSNTTGPAFNVPASNLLRIDIDYQRDLPGGLSTPGSHSLQPQSRNPSISEISPMITEDEIFHPPHQPDSTDDGSMSSTYGGMLDLPNNDFALFGGSGDPIMMPSTADISYEPVDLFSNAETEYSDSQLGRYVNF